MKKCGLILILTIFTYQACYCQPLPTKKQQYSFLRWYLASKKPKSLSNNIIRFDENMVVLSSIRLDNSNINYLKKQLGSYTPGALLDTTMLKSNYWATIRY